MPRLFTGLQIPQSVCNELSCLRGGLEGARWIEDESLHLTLRFVGDVDQVMADDIYDELSEIQAEPFSVTIDDIICFGGDRPRAIVARARRDLSLLQLHAAHERAVRRAGASAEPRHFVPHITIARLKSKSALEVANYMNTRGLFRPQTFIVDQFVVYSSRASIGGGPYVIEAVFPLG